MGKRVYLVMFHPLPEQECVNIYRFDISDQKELEEKLRESERRLSEAQKQKENCRKGDAYARTPSKNFHTSYRSSGFPKRMQASLS